MLQKEGLAPDKLVVVPWVNRGSCGDAHRDDISTLFELLDSNDTDVVVSFLETVGGMGVDPLTIIIDMWKACRAILAKVLPGAARQLCVSYATKRLIERTCQNMLTYYCELPEETEAQRAVKRMLWYSRHLLLGAGSLLTEGQQGDVETLLQAHRGTVLARAYDCKEAILALFRSSQSKEEAWARRGRIVQRFGDVPELREVIDLIKVDEFERMIGYLPGREMRFDAPRACHVTTLDPRRGCAIRRD